MRQGMCALSFTRLAKALKDPREGREWRVEVTGHRADQRAGGREEAGIQLVRGRA